jgi:tetratricopeptide (TPR) repeat protein
MESVESEKLGNAEALYLYLDARAKVSSVVRGLANPDRLTTALAELNRAIQLAPHYAEAYALRADVQDQLGDLEGAIESAGKAQEAFQAQGDSVQAGVYERQKLYLGLQRQSLVEKNLHEVAFEDMPEVQQILLRSAAFAQEKRYSEAIAEATRAINLYPDMADSWAIRGNIFRLMGDRQAACRDYEQAVELFEQQSDSVRVETLRLMIDAVNSQE